MKILHISTMDHGGSGKSALRLHIGLKSIGIESKMLVLSRHSSESDVVEFKQRNNNIFKRAANELRCRLISLEQYPYRYKRPKSYDSFTGAKTIYKISRHPLIKEADIIQLRWITWMIDYKEFFSNIGNKPIVWRLSDMNPFTGGCHYLNGCTKYQTGCGACPQLGSSNPNDLSRKIFKAKENAYRDHNMHIVAISKWHADCVKKSPLFKSLPIDIIPNGLPTDIFKKQDRQLSRSLLNLPLDKTLILFGASYKTERKGFKYLLEALKILKNKVDPSKIGLVIFGYKDELDSFSKATKYTIYQLGCINSETLLASVYSSCDIFVIPSLEEAFGQTCLESMACETPVVGFDTGGMADMISSYETGLLAELKNTQDLSQKIEYMVAHPKQRQEIGENARKLVEQEYTLEIQAKRYLKIYETIYKSKN